MASAGRVSVLLFDLGGVLLRLRDPIETFGLPLSPAEFRALWLASPSVRAYEAGRLDTERFARNVVAETGMPYDWREFLARFDAWPERLFDGTLDVLAAIPRGYRRALLSNINPQHWGRDTISRALDGCFERTFLSYETGLVKPDPACFAHVVDCLGCSPREVLFFDDSEDNVAAAAGCGMQAVQSMGIGAVRAELRRRGILG